jgi:hypothetical protein
MLYFVKIFTSALIIFAVSELSKKSSFAASLLISLPLISIISLSWIYFEQKDAQKIIGMSYEIFWLVIPSLSFFLFLPLLLKNGINFYLSLFCSCILTILIYFIFIYVKNRI